MNSGRPKVGEPARWLEYDAILPMNVHSIANEFSGAAPPILWHYTSIGGLQGIIANRNVWASDLRYLNDSEEFHWAIRRAQEYLARIHREISNDSIKAALSVTVGQFEYPENYGGYVFSLSESKDSLSMWRAYCHDGGYAIGLRFSFSASDERTVILAKCLYDDKSQFDLIRRTVARYQEVFGPHADKYPEQRESHITEIYQRLTRELLVLAPMIKHESFEDEHEWRLIVPPKPNLWRLSFCPGRSMLTPYVELPWKGSDYEITLANVVVGPMPQADLAAESVRRLIYQEKLGNVPVLNSDSPFRDW